MLGKTGYSVSEVSLGTWQLGGKWGTKFEPGQADRTLEAALESGINFFDTADVYKGGESEKAVARFVARHRDDVFFATKCGRKLSPHVSQSYTPEAVRGFVDDSLTNTGLDSLDLFQLHCPPTDVFYRPELFETLGRLKDEGKIRNCGVSVEKVEEGIKAIEFPLVSTVQIIFNMFRQRPAELFFALAADRNVGIIVRVPLASGLLTGRFGRSTVFEKGDHRLSNRQGEMFDRGETFAGVDYETGIEAVEELTHYFPERDKLPLYALKWILSFPAVSCVIPGASRPEQAVENARASDLDELSDEQLRGVGEVYEKYIKESVHQRW